METTVDELQLEVDASAGKVSAMYMAPAQADVVYALAHGAGAPMRHPFMERLARQLAEQRVATLRYNFPYTEATRKRPDPPAVLETTVRAAIERAVDLAAGRTVIAGGKSMGGRMTSQALAKRPDTRVKGVVFVGFPLHQPGKPSTDRAAHLADLRSPMLFLQGTRDSLAKVDLIAEVCTALGARAQLEIVDQADHSFAVPKRTGKSSDDVIRDLAVLISQFARSL